MLYNVANFARSSARELDLLYIVKSTGADIVIVTECELRPEETLTLPGYTTHYATVSPIGKIRLAILLVDHLAATASVIETTAMDVWISVQGVLVAGIYRQWAVEDERAALMSFYQRCVTNLSKSRRIFVGGDFNLDVSRRCDLTYSRASLLREHFENMESLGMSFVGPDSPTYFSYGKYNGSTRSSILDYAYTAGIVPVNVNVLDYAATDHRPVIYSLSSPHSRNGTKSISLRNLKNVTTAQLCLSVDGYLPANLYSIGDVNAVHEAIVSAITRALDDLSPLRTVMVKEGNTLSLAGDTLATMRARDKAAKSDMICYRSLRNKVARLVRRDRINSVRKSVMSSGVDAKKMWKIAKESVGMDTSPSVPPSLSATKLNSFYINKVESIRSSISPAPLLSATLPFSPTRFSFKYPHAGKVARIIKGLKNTSALGADGISVQVLKRAADVLSAPLAHLIQVSFNTNRVPDAFKLATITPVFKGHGKDPNEAGSYRPVAILPAISKVLEKVVADALSTHLEQILPAEQFGFRPNRNCAAAIATAHGAMSMAKFGGMVSALAAYDFSSAFDTVDSTIMTTKLDRLGIQGKPNLWFKDYLTNRFQRVSSNGTMSSYLPVKYGVPQGSILGPLLFLAMVAELPAALSIPPDLGCTVGYADDIVAIARGKSEDDVKQILEDTSKTIISYATSHYLAINPSKTQIMWTGTNNGPSLTIGDSTVSGSTSINLLGVGFNKLLRPVPFMISQAKSARKILGITRRMLRHLPPNMVAKISGVLFTGKLGYGLAAAVPPRLIEEDPINGGVQELQTIVNTAARCILRKKLTDKVSVQTLLAQTGLPSINRLAVRSAALESWRAIQSNNNNRHDNPLGHLIGNPGSGTRATRANTRGLLPPPTTTKDTLAWSAYKIWNSCEDLRLATSLTAAKKAASCLARSAPL